MISNLKRAFLKRALIYASKNGKGAKDCLAFNQDFALSQSTVSLNDSSAYHFRGMPLWAIAELAWLALSLVGVGAFPQFGGPDRD